MAKDDELGRKPQKLLPNAVAPPPATIPSGDDKIPFRIDERRRPRGHRP